MLTLSDFRLLFPAFASVDEATVNAQIALSAPYFDAIRWGQMLKEGMGNYVAHSLAMNALLTKPNSTGMADNTLSQKVGEVQVQNSDSMLQMQAKNPFMRTTYGQRYMYLLKIVGAGMIAI